MPTTTITITSVEIYFIMTKQTLNMFIIYYGQYSAPVPYERALINRDIFMPVSHVMLHPLSLVFGGQLSLIPKPKTRYVEECWGFDE